jgi:hypothetical protein
MAAEVSKTEEIAPNLFCYSRHASCLRGVTMKSLLAAAVLAGAISANAIVFTPTPGDLGDLDHHKATTWGITWNVPTGEVITGAKLTIKNIWDWQVESDKLFIHLLDDPRSGVTSIYDNTADNVISDYFSGQGVLLTSWSDPYGGHARNFDLVYNFTSANLTTLRNYLTDPNPYGTGDFGFGLDPDCHYYNSGVTFEIITKRVPDNGSTLLLMSLGLLGLATFASRKVPVAAPCRARKRS